MTWDALFQPFADDVLSRGVLVVDEPLTCEQCSADEFARRLLSEVPLEQSARAHLPRVASWLGQLPHVAAVADLEGVILCARESDPTGDQPAWAPGTCLLSQTKLGTAIRGARVVVIDVPSSDWCTLLIPLSGADHAPSGVLAFACPRQAIDRFVASIAMLSARAIGLSVDIQHIHQHNDRVLAMIGHELRQPLAALVTALDLVGRTSRVPKKPFEVAHRQTVQLVHLVNGLLDVSRMMTGKLRMSRRLSDLRRVVTHAVESVRADVEACGQHLEVRMPDKAVWCLADPVRLQQVVVNLLSNANRYTPEGGAITVTLESGETVTLTVRDTGEGIDPSARDRIFQPFMQSGHHAQGLGLGLAISRGIVHMHGGRISVQAGADDKGSAFIVRLPGVLEHTREVRNSVMRTRAETRALIERARLIRSVLEPHRAR